MSKLLGVALTLLIVGTAMAAPPTCYDLLIRTPQRSYSCDQSVSDGGSIQRTIQFDSIAGAPIDPVTGQPQIFRAIYGAGFEFMCSCDGKGRVGVSKFNVAKEFTCAVVLGGGSGCSVLRGKVAGNDGSRIVAMQSFDFNATPLSTVGTCSLLP